MDETFLQLNIKLYSPQIHEIALTKHQSCERPKQEVDTTISLT